MKCSYGKIFIPVTETSAVETEITVTGWLAFSYEHIEYFTKEIGQWDSVRAHDMFFFVCSATLFCLQHSSFLFAAFLFFICSVPFFIFAAVPFFVCSASFLFAAFLFCLQRFFFVCSVSILFASVSFLFAAFLFYLQRFFFVCSVSFLFAACPLWATVFVRCCLRLFCLVICLL